MASTYGERQPALDIAQQQHYTIPQIAEIIGENPSHLGSALRGRAYPSELIRDTLPVVLGVPLEQLFNPDRLHMPYGGPRGRNGGRRKATER